MIKSLDGLIKGFGILKLAVADFNMGLAEYIYLFWIKMKTLFYETGNAPF